MTETAVIVLCDKKILIWAIPPWSPQLDSTFFERHPTYMPPPLFIIPFPDGIVAERLEIFGWKTICSWYFGSSHSLYFDMFCEDYTFHRFRIMLAPNLSTISLHVINTHEPVHDDFDRNSPQGYRICEDTLVFCSSYDDRRVFTGLTSPRFANAISPCGPAAMMLLPDIGLKYFLYLCPASGRFVRVDETNSVAILDFF